MKGQMHWLRGALNQPSKASHPPVARQNLTECSFKKGQCPTPCSWAWVPARVGPTCGSFCLLPSWAEGDARVLSFQEKEGGQLGRLPHVALYPVEKMVFNAQ